jgi:hypothetical protein
MVAALLGRRSRLDRGARENHTLTLNRSVSAAFATALLITAAAWRVTPPRFVPHEIATGLSGGYQVVAADLNRDGKPDLIAVASNLPTLTWYENPTWTPHVLATGFRGLINVAVADLDGDGIPEIAVAHGFSTNPAQSAGNVSILAHSANVNDPWTMREIDRVPSAHRLRWFRTGNETLLINSPLANASAQPPDYAGSTPIYFYRAPDFKRETLTTEEQGVVHAIEPIGGRLYAAGFAGIHLYDWARGAWTRSLVVAGDPAPAPKGGSSDVRFGKVGVQIFLTTIEPWHGNQVVVYRETRGAWGSRLVIDSTVVDGHALVVADLDGDGSDEIILGQRGGTRSAWIYTASSSGTWTRTTLDDGGMAAAGCIAVDLNGDGHVDVACIGTATANLKWYENKQ